MHRRLTAATHVTHRYILHAAGREKIRKQPICKLTIHVCYTLLPALFPTYSARRLPSAPLQRCSPVDGRSAGRTRCSDRLHFQHHRTVPLPASRTTRNSRSRLRIAVIRGSRAGCRVTRCRTADSPRRSRRRLRAEGGRRERETPAVEPGRRRGG